MAKKPTKIDAELSKLDVGDWIEFVYRPQTQMGVICEVDESNDGDEPRRVWIEVNGNDGNEIEIELGRVKSIKQLDEPSLIEIPFADGTQILTVFPDGRAILDGQKIDKAIVEKLFSNLGQALGHKIAS